MSNRKLLKMKIIDLRNNAVLADKAQRADTFLKRLVGLLNRKSLDEGEALILQPSNCIHMFFMRFSIDVLFLDKNDKIVVMLSSFRPFSLSRIYFEAFSVVELPEGIIKKTMPQIGDILKVIE